MSYKKNKTNRVEKKPPSPAQEAVRKYGRRLFSTGSTDGLIKSLQDLKQYTAALEVQRAINILRAEAREEYEKERLRLDPEFETASMRQIKLNNEWLEFQSSLNKPVE